MPAASRPSTKPASLRPSRNAATTDTLSLANLLLRNPTTGIADCCARAVSGHAAAAPLRRGKTENKNSPWGWEHRTRAPHADRARCRRWRLADDCRPTTYDQRREWLGQKGT